MSAFFPKFIREGNSFSVQKENSPSGVPSMVFLLFTICRSSALFKWFEQPVTLTLFLMLLFRPGIQVSFNTIINFHLSLALFWVSVVSSSWL